MNRRDLVRAGLFGGIMIFSPTLGRFFRERPAKPRIVAMLEVQCADGSWKVISEVKSFSFSTPNNVLMFDKSINVRAGERISLRSSYHLGGYEASPYNTMTISPIAMDEVMDYNTGTRLVFD